MQVNLENKTLNFALAVGVLGGAGLIIGHNWFFHGKYVLIAYAIYVLAILIALRLEGVSEYRRRFRMGFAAFAVAAVAHYIFVILERKVVTVVSPIGHLWRLGFMLLIGAIISLAIARLSGQRSMQTT